MYQYLAHRIFRALIAQKTQCLNPMLAHRLRLWPTIGRAMPEHLV